MADRPDERRSRANRVDRVLAPPGAGLPIVEAWRRDSGVMINDRRTFGIAGGLRCTTGTI